MKTDHPGKSNRTSGTLQTLIGIVVAPLVIALILFSFYALGQLLISIAVTFPIAKWGKKIKSGEVFEHFGRFIFELFFLPFFIAALGAPFAVVAFFVDTIHPLGGQTSISVMGLTIPGLEVGPWFNYLSAALGIVFGLYLGWEGRRLVRRRTSLMEGMPTSRVKAARPGPIELTGRVSHLPDVDARKAKISGASVKGMQIDGQEPIIYWRRRMIAGQEHFEYIVNRFLLEDGTGSIIVDPLEAEFFQPGEMIPGAQFKSSQILLANRTKAEKIGLQEKSAEMSLLPGDKVYLLGPAIAEQDSSGERRLVVKASDKPITPPILMKLLLKVEGPIGGKSARNLFILADRPESSVKALLGKGIRNLFIISLIWVVPSLALWAYVLISVLR